MKVEVPGDKSLSHRRVLFELLVNELKSPLPPVDEVENLLHSNDLDISQKCVSLIKARKSMELYCGNSGTTVRLLFGILAGNTKTYRISGDDSLSLRPMDRVLKYLEVMGCKIKYLDKAGYLPLEFTGVGIIEHRHFDFELIVASAQVKSALLLAGLTTKSSVTLSGKINSRDHTEVILQNGGVELEIDFSNSTISLSRNQVFNKKGLSQSIASDPSSAAFWVLYSILTHQSVSFNHLCLSHNRIGFYQILKDSGFDIEWSSSESEVGDLSFRPTRTFGHSICMSEDQAASCIDEIPLLAVIACFFVGEHRLYGASELRLKESNRLEAARTIVEALGASFNVQEDQIIIKTEKKSSYLSNISSLESSKDHRIIMTLGILTSTIEHDTFSIIHPEVVEVSYPRFWDTLERMNNRNKNLKIKAAHEY